MERARIAKNMPDQALATDGPKQVDGPKNLGGRPLKYQSVEQVQGLIDGYFVDCDERDQPYTVTGLALALDLDRRGLIEYQRRWPFANAIKRAKAKVQGWLEAQAYSRDKQVAGVIFGLKNNYGWADKSETTTNVNVQVSEITHRIVDPAAPQGIIEGELVPDNLLDTDISNVESDS